MMCFRLISSGRFTWSLCVLVVNSLKYIYTLCIHAWGLWYFGNCKSGLWNAEFASLIAGVRCCRWTMAAFSFHPKQASQDDSEISMWERMAKMGDGHSYIWLQGFTGFTFQSRFKAESNLSSQKASHLTRPTVQDVRSQDILMKARQCGNVHSNSSLRQVPKVFFCVSSDCYRLWRTIFGSNWQCQASFPPPFCVLAADLRFCVSRSLVPFEIRGVQL